MMHWIRIYASIHTVISIDICASTLYYLYFVNMIIQFKRIYSNLLAEFSHFKSSSLSSSGRWIVEIFFFVWTTIAKFNYVITNRMSNLSTSVEWNFSVPCANYYYHILFRNDIDRIDALQSYTVFRFKKKMFIEMRTLCTPRALHYLFQSNELMCFDSHSHNQTRMKLSTVSVSKQSTKRFPIQKLLSIEKAEEKYQIFYDV